MTPSNLEILAYEDSPLGPLCLRRRELLSKPGTVVTEITLNHEFLMGSYHTESERALARGGLEFHRDAGPGDTPGSPENRPGSTEPDSTGNRDVPSETGSTERGSTENRDASPENRDVSTEPGPWEDWAVSPKPGSSEKPVPRALRVLVGGLGLGYTTQAVLESSLVGRVDVFELLPQVIDWMRNGLVPLSAELTADPRFHPILGDVYAHLRAPIGSPLEHTLYDLILIDVDHSPDDRLGGDNQTFYTMRGLERAKAHLAPGGVLGVWSYTESSSFSLALREVFPNVRVTPIRFWNRMADCEVTDWLFFAK